MRAVDLTTSSEKTLPLEKSKPRVDPPVEPIGDGYCLDLEKTPKRMIGTDQPINGEKWRSPEKRLAPRWEVEAPSQVESVSLCHFITRVTRHAPSLCILNAL